jgi:DNA polymerase
VQEDLIILLDWFIANGISEFFNDSTVGDNFGELQNIYNNPPNRSLDDTVAALARQQKNIKNLIYGGNSKTREIADHLNDLNQLVDIINNIDVYDNFRKMAMNTIILGGNVNSKILVINDLPNDEDDASGVIFSGKSGELFGKMLKLADIDYNGVCFLNSFFWRLPGNRAPIVEELEICRPFVEKIIGLLEPKFIIFSGNYSVTTLFEKNKTLANLRGKILDYDNCYLQSKIKTTGTYSPSFLLRHGERKKDSWSDLVKIKEFLSEAKLF